MVLKIIIKKAGSFNKDQTLQETLAPTAVQASTQADELEPFIDRISVILDMPSGEMAHLSYNAFINLGDEIWQFKQAKPTKGFKRGKRLVLGSGVVEKAFPHLSVNFFQSQMTKLRLEFSPVDLGVVGMADLHSALTVFLDGGWDRFYDHGIVTKIEVSVDIPKLSTSDIYILPTQTTTAQTWKNNGKLETVVLGKPQGSSRTRIYDRGAKRKAKGQHSSHYEGTRVERILRLSTPLNKIGELSNPFKKIGILMALPAPPMETRPYIWEMFTDSVAARGLPSALKLLPQEKRTMYRAWLNQETVSWWDADKLWEKWPKYLAESGLIPPGAKS